MSEAGSRFYKEVAVAPAGLGYQVLLDGRAVRTPSGMPLVFPNFLLAEAAAEEWRRQGQKLDPASMPITRLANTAIDRVARNRAEIIAQIAAYGESDVLSYRADSPPELAALQSASWNPMLRWAEERYGATLMSATGIGFVAQPRESLARLEEAVEAHDDFALAALHGAVTLLGSLVLGLALAQGRLEPDEAIALANLDEIFQAERWGRDSEAERRARSQQQELIEIANVLRLLRA